MTTCLRWPYERGVNYSVNDDNYSHHASAGTASKMPPELGPPLIEDGAVQASFLSDPFAAHRIRSIDNGRTRTEILRRHLKLPTISIASPAKPSASKLPAQPTQSDQAAPAVQDEAVGGSDEPSNPVGNENGSENLVSQTAEKLTPVSFSNQAEVNSSKKDAVANGTISSELPKRNSARGESELADSSVDSKSVNNPGRKETSGVTDSELTETPDLPKKKGMAASMLASGNSWNSGT